MLLLQHLRGWYHGAEGCFGSTSNQYRLINAQKYPASVAFESVWRLPWGKEVVDYAAEVCDLANVRTMQADSRIGVFQFFIYIEGRCAPPPSKRE